MKRILVLGGGTAGSMMANKLVKRLGADWTVTVIDRDDVHLYQPGFLFIPFGDYSPEEVQRSRKSLLDERVELRLCGARRVEPDNNRVYLGDGSVLDYTVLIVATGTRLVPENTEGLTGVGWQQSAFDFYTLDGSTRLAAALERFEGGRLLVNVVENPIKCPVAPLEFLFLAESWLRKRGLRDKTELVYATPLPGAFTKPRSSAVLGGMMEEKGIRVQAEFAAASVDGERGVLTAFDGRQEDYDLLVTVPSHAGDELVSDSGMGDYAGFLPTHKHSLQSKAFENVFAIGDCTDLPASKAGAVAHFQGEVLIENVLRYIEQLPLLETFDGHANCFIESGDGKALLIDFNYDTEPLPGRFPLPGIGPFTLLEESHVNHWGKLGFKWVYWNMLVKGEELPLDHRMLMAGKWS
ncbi:MAG: FAD/NAD(P)-binding oxidoreductase [Myxococcota bacterium]|nr:FAD/NAD(P)-binding oxidoreductase [Myxococcota bacterium]